ncbi:zinc ion binding [Branchiostoma belcheri]|nr:zinc ion binding [Branchiostoma belcheri]
MYQGTRKRVKRKEGHRFVAFVKEGKAEKGRKGKRAGKEDRGILFPANDWVMRVDLEMKLKFPEVILETNLRPDIVLWSEETTQVVIIELTVPWEDRFEEAHDRKAEKYRDGRTSTDDVVEAKHAAKLYQVNPNAQSTKTERDGHGDLTTVWYSSTDTSSSDDQFADMGSDPDPKLLVDKTPKEDKCGVIYHISCQGNTNRGPCRETYIGETERSQKNRFLEHRRPSSVASEVSQHIHIESPGHTVDLEGVRILDTEQDYFKRGIKEAIYIRSLQPSLNRDGGRYRLQTTFDPLLTSHVGKITCPQHLEYLTRLFETHDFGTLATTHSTRPDRKNDDVKHDIQDTDFWKSIYANGGFFFQRDTRPRHRLRAYVDTNSTCRKETTDNRNILQTPLDKGNSLDELDRSIDKLGAKVNSDNVIILGDFNTPGINWDISTTDNTQTHSGQIEKPLCLMDNHGLSQTMQEPTRNGKLLDLVLVNNPNIIERTTVFPRISDYDMVLVDVNLAPKQNRKPKRKVYIRTKADKPAIKKDLTDYAKNFGKRTEDMSVSQKWADFKGKMEHTMNRHIPSNMTSSKYNLNRFNRYLRRHRRNCLNTSSTAKHLESHNILTDYQHGFRAKRSTETQLILTVHDIAGALNSKNQVDLAILDFTKAFDKVPHGRLISKLQYYGIQGTTLNWLKAFLTNREQTVVMEGKASAPVRVASGVPPVNQQDIQQHLNSTIPEERKDTSPGDVKESLQDALSGASAEHSAQDHVPGHSTDDGTERPSLPTVGPSHTNIGKTDQNQAFHSEKPSLPETCTSDTHGDPVKQNQALCADNSQEKAEQQSSTEIYDAEGYNENNVEQYQVRDTCVKEVSSTAYQCSEDVDEASIGNDCSKRGAEGLDQPVAKQLEDAENSYQNEFELEEGVTADDSCIRPYAVAYQADSKTNGEEDDIFDVQPYAVAYDEQDINYDEQQPTTGQSADCSHGEWRGPNTSLAESVAGKTDGLLRNPMYIGNVLHQNPMYAPNAAQPRADGENENKDLQQKTIIFQLKCEESSDCSGVNSVAVSPCNEIFIADTFNRQVQVFSMKGVSLRSFPTVTSGENSEAIEPDDISIDGEGHVWVVGNAYRMSGFIVRYTKLGSHLTTLRATFSNNSLSGMTVDTLRNLVVATEHWWGYREVKLLHFNGTVEHKFRVQQGSGYPGVVAVGREGNLFVSDSMGDARVHVYNNRSQYLYSFGGHDIDKGRSEVGLGSTEIGMGLAGIGEGRTEIDLGKTEIGEGITETDENEADEVTGICTDGSGNVLLVRSGGAVDMFTEDGRYVRRVVPSRAGGVAVAPGGQLMGARTSPLITEFELRHPFDPFEAYRKYFVREVHRMTKDKTKKALVFPWILDVAAGKLKASAESLLFRDPDMFRAGEIHNHDRGHEGNMEGEKGMTKPNREAAKAAVFIMCSVLGQEREEIIAVKETEALGRVLVSAEERGEFHRQGNGRVGRDIARLGIGNPAAGNTFRRYLQKLGIDEGETLHGCRSGCAISLHMAGASDREVMDHVGWFTGRTASHYMKITQVMGPGGPAARIASQEVRPSWVFLHAIEHREE